MKQLDGILHWLYADEARGMNILLRGPSGWGKTRMAFMICNYLSAGHFEYCLGDKMTFDKKLRVHFIDEVHLLKEPEVLYPDMDSGKFVIILATNDVDPIKEALSNRCTQFIFEEYSLQDLREIAKPQLQYKFPDKFLDTIIDAGANNPRIIKNIISRINILMSFNQTMLEGLSMEQFNNFLHDSFGIQDGMDVMCNRYLTTLKTLGGTASIQTLASVLHIDSATVRYYVEPILLYKGKIKITSKGRSLNDNFGTNNK